MADLKIRTIWEEGVDGDMPWLVAAVDEYTIEEHGGIPDFYKKEMTKGRQELVITVPDKAVLKLFEVPVVEAKVQT